jgi:hypothetical protein
MFFVDIQINSKMKQILYLCIVYHLKEKGRSGRIWNGKENWG